MELHFGNMELGIQFGIRWYQALLLYEKSCIEAQNIIPELQYHGAKFRIIKPLVCLRTYKYLCLTLSNIPLVSSGKNKIKEAKCHVFISRAWSGAQYMRQKIRTLLLYLLYLMTFVSLFCSMLWFKIQWKQLQFYELRRWIVSSNLPCFFV